MSKNNEIMTKIENLQSCLASGKIQLNVACGNDPFIAILGGIHARAAIDATRQKFPNFEDEFNTIYTLVCMLDDATTH